MNVYTYGVSTRLIITVLFNDYVRCKCDACCYWDLHPPCSICSFSVFSYWRVLCSGQLCFAFHLVFTENVQQWPKYFLAAPHNLAHETNHDPQARGSTTYEGTMFTKTLVFLELVMYCHWNESLIINLTTMQFLSPLQVGKLEDTFPTV